MAEWIRVAASSDIVPGKIKSAMARDLAVILFSVDGSICALEDRCSHDEYPLSDGELDGKDIVCMYHGARFDACSGRNKTLPAVRPVRAFPVEVREGEVFVQV
jgi:nitrite reductase/ring-hydroxylating ferredoxin subunit